MANAVPRYEFEKITDIAVDDLRAMGAKAVGIDLDNTTVKDASFKIISGVREWVRGVLSAGIPVIIITNTYSLRARIMAKRLGGLPWLAMSDKPKTGNFYKAAKKLGIDVSELVMIGDRVFEDCKGANAAGAISVRVKPYGPDILLAKKFREIRKKEIEYLERHKNGEHKK